MSNSVIVIADKSGSLYPYSSLYLKTINDLIKLDCIINTHLSLIFFNDDIQYLHVNHPAKNISVDKISFEGETAFYDNVSAIINRMLKFYKFNNQKPPIVIILTDGEDNCSRKLKKEHLTLQIAIAKSYKWQFIFLGVNEKCVGIGKEIGCDSCILYDFSEKSLNDIPKLISSLFKEKVVPNMDFDLRDSFEKMKI